MKPTKQYAFNGLAGCVRQTRNQTTKFMVGMYNCVQAGMEDDPETPWATVCEEHHTLVCHHSFELARSHLADPEGWCESCRMGYLYNRMQDGYVVLGDVISRACERVRPVRLVPSRAEATMIGVDAAICKAAMIAGYPNWQYNFVRATHADMELERQRG